MINTTLRHRTITFGAAGLLASALLAAGPLAAAPAAADTTEARLLGYRDLDRGLKVDSTTVGGLSGIDRDPRTGEYLMISDDRSTVGPARYYTADIDVRASGVEDVKITSATELTKPDGGAYPSYKQSIDSPCTGPQRACDRDGAVDPEELRVDPVTKKVWWSTEGTNKSPTVLNPALRASSKGRTVQELPLPRDFRFDRAERRGPRGNLSLEAFAFTDKGKRIVTALEGPMIQDGPAPTPEKGALTRISEHTRSGEIAAQYAYPLDPVFAAPKDQPYMDNGVPAILPVDDKGRYLVLERAYSDGNGYRIRIYEVDTAKAQDVRRIDSLATEPPTRPLRKELVADLGQMGVDPVYNAEGMTWGPRLPNGDRTLVMVVDDNFSAEEKSQVIALTVSS
ncbi:esterase-like activity of phytase family protein [Murinocardiopsis flavida]|nr:esterase-like activity of phytase family protein [Murinocardiopsis flavida]